MNKADVILHPVRLRILQRFIGGKKLTAKELRQAFDTTIPQATLYRHLDALVKAEVLAVIEENPVRGTVEKVYALNEAAANVGQQDLAEATKEDHMQYFTMFMTQLLSNFEEYLEQGDIDLERDGVGYRQAAFYLTDEEFRSFMGELNQVFLKAAENKPSLARKKRLFSTIVMPKKGRGDENEGRKGNH